MNKGSKRFMTILSGLLLRCFTTYDAGAVDFVPVSFYVPPP
jgi:hypothetical protein